MYTLYASPGAASMVVHHALIEIGAPHEVRWLDLEAREQKSPAYLALNPAGVVPTLLVDGEPVGECAALLILLGERHPGARLAPMPGEPDRARYLQWMLHLANTVQPAFRQWFYPSEFGSTEREAAIKDNARVRIEAHWQRLDAKLAAEGPCLLGAEPGLVDFFAVMLMRWSRNMPRPATDWPALAALAARVRARPGWRELYRRERLDEWA
jgi:glutathione S-transferase